MERISPAPSPFGPGGPHRVGLFFGPGPGHGGPLGALLILFLVIAAVALVVLVIRQERMRHRGPLAVAGGGVQSLEALRILDVRFAKGEIDAEEYKTRRDLLRGST